MLTSSARARPLWIATRQAGLTNAVFLDEGSPGGEGPPPTLIEVLPRSFASRSSALPFLSKFGFLPTLGVKLTRLLAPEADPSCVMAARSVPERLRDCDVRLEWAAIERVLPAAVESV